MVGSSQDEAGLGSTSLGPLSGGAAFVFERGPSGWEQAAWLTASNKTNGNRFGYSVAVANGTVVAGDYFEDGGADGVNGEQSTNNVAVSSGAAYAFGVDGEGDWGEEAYLKSRECEVFRQFGYSVSTSGQYVLVGCNRREPPALYKKEEGGWAQLEDLKGDPLLEDITDGGSKFVAITDEFAVVSMPGRDKVFVFGRAKLKAMLIMVR